MTQTRATEDEGASPQGLRERKKRMQRLDLLEIAARLFRQHGYDATRMDDIAAQGNVSTKTVYNYFPNKQSLLAALLQEDRARLMSAYDAVLESPPSSFPEAIAALMQADIGQVLNADDKKLWRELIAAEVRSDQSKNTDLSSNRQAFLLYVERLLALFRDRLVLSADIQIDKASEIIYGIYYYNFAMYCMDDNMDVKEIRKKIKFQTEILVRPWLR